MKKTTKPALEIRPQGRIATQSPLASLKNRVLAAAVRLGVAASLIAPLLPLSASAAPLNCPISTDVTVTDGGTVSTGAACNVETGASLTIGAAGSIVNNGNLNTRVGSTLTNEGQLYNSLDGVLDNAGIASNKAGAFLINLNAILNETGGTLSNEHGGTLENNYTVLNNDGATVANDGDLQNTLNGIVDNFGSFVNLSNGTLTNRGAFDDDGQTTNAGTLNNEGFFSELGGSLMNLAGGTVTNDGALLAGADAGRHGAINNAGTLVNNETLSVDLGSLVNQSGGTLTNAGTFKVFGNSGTTSVAANAGTLNNAGQLTISNQGVLRNTGQLTNTGTLENMNFGSLDNSGSLTNLSSGRVTSGGDMSNDGSIVNYGSLTVENMDNEGSLINQGDFSALAVTGNGSFWQSLGTTTLWLGSIEARSVTITGGTVRGTSGAAGFSNLASPNTVLIGQNATLSPGASLAEIGDFVIDAPVDLFGRLDIDVESLGSFDSLLVKGNVAFDSDSLIRFALGNDTTQHAGDIFDFFDAYSFTDFDLLEFSIDGLFSNLDYTVTEINNGTGLRLSLVEAGQNGGGGSTSVPEPGSLALLGLGAALLGGSRKRYGRAPEA